MARAGGYVGPVGRDYIGINKDNQNIASALTLSAGTVKVHMHNILKKTGHANRAELAADFWER